MKAINFHFGEMAVSGAWSRLGFTDVLGRLRSGPRPQPLALVPHGDERESVSLLERLDRWMYRLQQRERDAWLGSSQNVFELEDRIRYLERSVGSRYY